MANGGRLNVAVVGLGFGAEFVPLWQKHPHTRCEAICQRDRQKLDAVGDFFGVEKRYTDFRDVLQDPLVDVVHINSPIPDHAWMSIAALKAGKHVACTVPMATSIADCKKIVQLVERTGLTYMMMETVVYSREYLYMKELLDSGQLGTLQFVQASHQQDMDGWPEYWPGLPPMWYATHCVGPVAGLIGQPAEYVSCFGSGTIRDELVARYGSPFAVESAHIRFRDSDVSGRVVRSLFDTARQYRESIDVYGSQRTVEWPLIEGESLIVHTAKRPEPEIPERVACPDFAGTATGRHRPLHDARRLRRRQEDAPQLHAGRRSRRQPPAPRARVRDGARRGTRSLPQRRAVGQLDLRRPLGPRVGAQGRRHRQTARLHPLGRRSIGLRQADRTDRRKASPSVANWS